MRREGEQWIGEFTLNADDSYRIDAMSSLSPEFAPASREYAVQALNDGRPTLAFIWPGRDLKVSAIEEVGLQIAGSDDIGIQRADLVISVNGAEETVVPLTLSAAGANTIATVPQEFLTKHVIAMEELSYASDPRLSRPCPRRPVNRARGGDGHFLSRNSSV